MPDILLEAGTNEVELIEFRLAGRPFAVNVLKLQEVVSLDPGVITPIPGQHPSLLGTFLLRGAALPIVDLDRHLHGDRGKPLGERSKVVLVTRINGVRCAFAVEAVHRIHRTSWKALEPLAPCLIGGASFVIASVHLEARDLLVVDLEAVIADIMPQTRFDAADPPAVHPPSAPTKAGEAARRKRSDLHILVAEDSRLIRAEILNVLGRAGVGEAIACADGQEAYDRLAAAKRGEAALPDMLLSDIEMPRLDGLTLCRRLRQELGFSGMPVVLFSSLIDEQMAGRCRSVGATAWVTKPRIADVVTLIDEHLLGDVA